MDHYFFDGWSGGFVISERKTPAQQKLLKTTNNCFLPSRSCVWLKKILAKAIGHQKVMHNLKLRKNIHVPENCPLTQLPLNKLIVCFSRFRDKESFQELSVAKQTDKQTPFRGSWLVTKSDSYQILYFHWLAINKSCIIRDGTYNSC